MLLDLLSTAAPRRTTQADGGSGLWAVRHIQEDLHVERERAAILAVARARTRQAELRETDDEESFLLAVLAKRP